MKRIITFLAVAVVMTALILAMVAPAFARVANQGKANPGIAGPATGDTAAQQQEENATNRPVNPTHGTPF